MLSDGPPSREAVTTSLTCLDSVEVKTLTSSGMMAPASVPQVMMVESFHHSVSSPPSSAGPAGTRRCTSSPTDTSEVTHTSCVSGVSKFILSALA